MVTEGFSWAGGDDGARVDSAHPGPGHLIHLITSPLAFGGQNLEGAAALSPPEPEGAWSWRIYPLS